MSALALWAKVCDHFRFAETARQAQFIVLESPYNQSDRARAMGEKTGFPHREHAQKNNVPLHALEEARLEH